MIRVQVDHVTFNDEENNVIELVGLGRGWPFFINVHHHEIPLMLCRAIAEYEVYYFIDLRLRNACSNNLT